MAKYYKFNINKSKHIFKVETLYAFPPLVLLLYKLICPIFISLFWRPCVYFCKYYNVYYTVVACGLSIWEL